MKTKKQLVNWEKHMIHLSFILKCLKGWLSLRLGVSLGGHLRVDKAEKFVGEKLNEREKKPSKKRYIVLNVRLVRKKKNPEKNVEW